jgi:hypothetical protein
VRLGEQSGEPPEVPAVGRTVAPARPGPATRRRGADPGAPHTDLPVQVPDQSCGPLAAEHLPDHRSRLRTASAAASSRSARRTHSAAYGRRSPDRCPVAFSFATAWFRLTPIRRTSPAARISSVSACRNGASAGFISPRAAANVACAAYAPLAIPACAADSPTSPYSSSVSPNRTLRARRTACRDRRRDLAAILRGPPRAAATPSSAANARAMPSAVRRNPPLLFSAIYYTLSPVGLAAIISTGTAPGPHLNVPTVNILFPSKLRAVRNCPPSTSRCMVPRHERHLTGNNAELRDPPAITLPPGHAFSDSRNMQSKGVHGSSQQFSRVRPDAHFSSVPRLAKHCHSISTVPVRHLPACDGLRTLSP